MNAAYVKPQASRGTVARRVIRIAIVVISSTLAVASGEAAAKDNVYGPYGPEGPRMREQLWIVPSGDPARTLRATLFRPEAPAGERLPLVVINHGTSAETRLSVAMPVFYWLSRWFVDRGYAVVLPQRRGYGATGGRAAEDIDTCSAPDHYLSGQIAADDIDAVVNFMAKQPFIAAHRILVAGISTGGWGSLALASRNPARLQGVINFSGGRGGHAGGRRNAVCGEARLVAAAAAYGSTARIPSIWFYARNDSYFGPKLATEMARAWNRSGGEADLHLLPPYGGDGHVIADDRAGWRLWGNALDRFLSSLAPSQLASSGKSETVHPRTPVVTPASLSVAHAFGQEVGAGIR